MTSSPTEAAGRRPPGEAESERRVVSILFADLVGFTAISETRDAEDVRELLSRYFETSRRIVGRYGGVVEKFIGDAVMAVWGTPVAKEDDAERAVRAALELTDAVAAMGAEVGAPELRARCGVLTGEAAVTIGAQGEGMVAGDLVNTASRAQSAAQPGAVLVGDGTRRATEAAVVYEDGGLHELKGKAEPVHLWRALRVVAGRGGLQRAQGLEAPFVGRDRELRLVKDLFHGVGEERKAHLVLVTGIAGIGKSRLSWEFEKYADGVEETIWWHRGRCLAYGDGVAYWALGEMVRSRARITEGEEPGSALQKLHATLEQHVLDEQERAWIEPGLVHLLGLEDRSVRDREELFAAWRLFFERLSDEHPTVLVFEDLQWADPALLDFIDYLLDWSRSHPLFLLCLARPELADRRPGWGTGRRSFTSLFLDPLSPVAMRELLAGLVPGLPDELATRILERAEGVPLYAVETVRMLLDRGLLERNGQGYKLTGPVESLDIPESLQALIAARLDALPDLERRLLQDASVLGKVFTLEGLSTLTGRSREELEGQLTSLIRKEFLARQADPRSPERGQFGFLQDVVRRVSYEMLSKKERKRLHLAAAALLTTAWGGDEDELVEIVASHYLEAYELAPDAPDAGGIRGRARETLARAGERAGSLAATHQARRHFKRAAELAEDPVTRALMLERAGTMAERDGDHKGAIALDEEAITLLEAEGCRHDAARVSAALAEPLQRDGRIDEAVERLEASFAVLSEEGPGEDLATLAAQLGRVHYFSGNLAAALERIDFGLEIAEALWLPEVLSQGLNTKSLVLDSRGRYEESLGLIKRAHEIALENELSTAALRSYFNMAFFHLVRDRYEAALELDLDGLALARRMGSRQMESYFVMHLAIDRYYTGDWEAAVGLLEELPTGEMEDAGTVVEDLHAFLMAIYAERGARAQVERGQAGLAHLAVSGDVQDQNAYWFWTAVASRVAGRPREALEAAEKAFALREALGNRYWTVILSLQEAVEAAFLLGDVEKARDLVAVVEGWRPSDTEGFMRGQIARLRSRLAIAEGLDDGVEAGFKRAAGTFRELGVPFWLAVVLLEHGGWLVARGRGDQAGELLAEAGEIFQRLGAHPWLERMAGVRAKEAVGTAADR